MPWSRWLVVASDSCCVTPADTIGERSVDRAVRVRNDLRARRAFARTGLRHLGPPHHAISTAAQPCGERILYVKL